MGDDTGDRLRGGVLAGAALLALVAGGWWWRANAPATGPDRAAGASRPSPSPDRSPSDPRRALEEALVASPGTTVRVRIDSETGRIIDATGMPGDDSEVGLPLFADTLWRERLTLVPGGEPVRRDSIADGARHMVQYRCTGDGELLISIVHAPSTDTSRTTCDGELGSLELPDPEASTRIDLSAVAGRIEVEAQLVVLR
ncbi:hypothetical protein ABZ807_00445 [Micromonospora sp. NPDC047548]|uniref:hypothetical protein n=1 Tax=Micromonospora sp. NPDC047548 TaxID=3155624 RepID=UPI0034058753